MLPNLTGIGYYDSPIGLIEIGATSEAIAKLCFVEQRLRDSVPTPLVVAALDELAQYFSGHLQHFDLPLALQGTPFQQQVWQRMLQVPYGETTTYKALAVAIGRPHATRAVGGAVGRNPLSIIVPCHRVLGSAGDLRGYSGGLWRKAWLLRREGITLL